MGDRAMVGRDSSPPEVIEPGTTQDNQDNPREGSREDLGLGDEPVRPGSNHGPTLSPEELETLWRSHRERFHRIGELGDLDKSIEYAIRALDLTPEGHPKGASRHANLGRSYVDRFKRLGNSADLDKAVEHDTLALALTPEGHPDLASRHTNLGVSFGNRFQRLNDLKDNNMSIEHYARALELTPEGHPNLAGGHGNLGLSYSDRFGRLGELKDLQNSIEHRIHALELTPEGHPDLARRHADLGVSFGNRFQRLGELEDNNRSIEHYTRALELTPEGHPDLARRNGSLAISYSDRFRRLGNPNDLQKSIEHRMRAVELTPDGHPDLARWHSDLGVSFGNRFHRLGDLGDNNRSIEHYTRALELTPEGHPDLARRYGSLGISYSDRFGRLGELSDLQNSIEHRMRALELTPEGRPDLASRHADLGVSFGSRFQRLDELEDNNRSIEHYTRALELTPEGHPDLANRHASLGISYNDRFDRLGELKDLQNSVEHRIHALELTPEGHPDLARRHADLGVSFGNRFLRLGALEDNNRSIEHYTRALELTPNDHPDLASRHTNLGLSYSDRFRRLRDPGDLEIIVKHESHALSLTQADHPAFPWRHFNRALTFCLQYEHTGDSLYLSHALDSYRTASQALAGSPRDKFRHALSWAKRSVQYPILSCIEAYQTTIDLLPQFVWLGASASQRYYDLSTAEDLAVSAASAAIHHSDLNLALEWLEHARCVVWNQSLMLRSPLDELESAHPDLADRLQVISRQLHDTGSEPSATSAHTYGSANLDKVADSRRHLAQEYQNLISRIRKLPKFDTFLQPFRSARLVRAARKGPIIVINCHDDRCDALIILPEHVEVKHLSLPNFSQQKARSARLELETSLRRSGFRDRGVRSRERPEYRDTIGSMLLTLWTDVVRPVLDFLGYMDNDSTVNLPHITWCPTGALSFLPLHAAGDYDHPRSRVFDYAISSYTPTLTALLSLSSGTSTVPPRMLAIGQELTSGHTPLPGTVTELAYIRGHAQDKAEYSQLTGSQATTAAVLDAMGKHDWVHLACHAHQNVSDPTKSGFFLHDGTLDLTSINRRSFKNKGLAFLSACQTATGDEKLPDEAVHLASGMLMAGYPSVIATMWSVHDKDAPLVADKVYAELMKEGKVGNGRAGKALHNAVGILRNEIGEKDFARWVPYIHIGS